jgi:hypothetical protein
MSKTETKEQLAMTLARLQALRLAFTSGMVPPVPVPEPFVRAFHDAIEEFADSRAAECSALKVSENELTWHRVGRKGVWRAPVYERFVDWRTFVTKLLTAIFYFEFLWDQQNTEDSHHAAIGFNRHRVAIERPSP